ncbi:MAG: MipA/OmpV family protein [Novosphingobium sp.]
MRRQPHHVRPGLAVIAGVAILATIPAVQAQSAAAPADSKLSGDYITLGAGAIYGPSYEGSDDMVATPVPVVQGRLAGIEITPRPGGIALDLLPDARGAKLGFSAGPVATWSGNRHRQIEDRVVRASGKLKGALDLGLNGGVTVYRLLHDHDSLTLSADVMWNANDAHNGMTVTPQISYFTPLSQGSFVALSASARHDDGDRARYYFSVNPAQSARSGLPEYRARSGWTKTGIGIVAGYDLNGNLLDGGFSVIVLGSYSRMLNDARRTPFTALRGQADQWLAGAGLGYTF